MIESVGNRKKFIIEDGCLILFEVKTHRELVCKSSDVSGGGFYEEDLLNRVIIFFGGSIEFGSSRYIDIRDCVRKGNVYPNLFCTNSIVGKYTFYYRNEYNDLTLLK